MAIAPHRLIDAGSKDLFRATSGRTYEALDVRNVGNGLVRIDRPATDIAMKHVVITGGYRAFETLVTSGQKDATVDRLLIEDVRATRLKRGFARIGYGSRRGIIRNVHASGLVNNDDIPCGIAFMDRAHDFTVQDCIMRGFRMELGAGHYWNGDGYSAERGNYGLRFLRCQAWDCTDGGFDLKSTGTFLDGCISGRNKYSYRFWSSVEAHKITSLNPRPGGGTGGYGHFSISADTPLTLRIGRLTARADDRAPLFTIHRGVAHIHVQSHDLHLPKGTPLVTGEGQAVFHWAGPPPHL